MTAAVTNLQPPESDGQPETAAAPAPALRVGLVLWDRYEVTAVMGRTRLGEVWRCTDRETGKEVCIRKLPPDMRRSKPVMAVIHAGLRRIANHVHPNLAIIRQLVYMGDQIYLVGDYAPGVDIGTWGRTGEGHKRTLDEVLPKLRQVAAALDFAHKLRIVHRNLKPTNIYLASDGVVRVTDFGLAPHHHLTIHKGQAARMGETGAYLAPELRRGEEPDSGSDQYALGVLAWELLAGAPPEPRAEPPVELPRSVRLALRQALAPKPRNRFVSCTDFVKALAGERVDGRRGRTAAEWRRIRRRTGLAAVLLGVGLGLVLGARWVVSFLGQAPVPVQQAPVLPELAPPPKPKPKPEPEAPPPVAPLVATTPLPEPGKPWVANTVPMEFVWVPALEIWVGRFEVTNEEFNRMDPEHNSGDFRGVRLTDPRQPVVRVNFDDTVAYAAWLTEQERAAGRLLDGWRYRLPSRMEAIAYTRAGTPELHFPWGERWPPARGNYADGELAKTFDDLNNIPEYQDGFPATAPVEASGENAWGIFGAGGNVWETTSKVPGGNVFGGWQGGAWDDYLPARLRSDTFYGFIGNARGSVNGFRLVLAPIAREAPPPPDPAAPAPTPPS